MKPVVGPSEDGCSESDAKEAAEMLHIMRRNQRLIAYCAAHYVTAYENELGMRIAIAKPLSTPNTDKPLMESIW